MAPSPLLVSDDPMAPSPLPVNTADTRILPAQVMLTHSIHPDPTRTLHPDPTRTLHPDPTRTLHPDPYTEPTRSIREVSPALAELDRDREQEIITITTNTRPSRPKTSIGLVEDIEDEMSAPARMSLREKRRVVAVAVVLSGSAESVRRELILMLGDLAYKRGAVVDREQSDCLVVVFGLEVAGEDDVAHAMSYALAAVEAAREASASVDSTLIARMAARGGIVAAPDDQGGYRLVGDAIEETIALAKSAEPGRPLLAGGAGRLTTAYFAFREVPARRQSWRRVRVLELLGPRSFDERQRALHGRRGRFFGRHRELAQLSQALLRAIRDKKRVVLLLSGASGIGKSRLISEFVARTEATFAAAGTAGTPGLAEDRPALVAVAAAPGGTMTPFSLTVEFLQAVLNLPPGHGEIARGQLSRRMRHVLTTAGLPSDEIHQVVGALELAMELRDGALISTLDASEDLLDRVISALHRLRSVVRPERRAAVLIIEDLHFADASSLKALQSSFEEGGDGAELVVVTCLDHSEVTDAVTGWAGEIIQVQELVGDERDSLIADRLAGSATAEATAAVAERAGGNPLLIEQIAAQARDVGEIPPTVRAVISARVDRLPPETKAVLQHAAVLGPRFRSLILEELLGRDIGPELKELYDADLLRRGAGPTDSYEDEVSFTSGLIREVVYESLSAGDRQMTHAKLGHLLATRYRAGREEPPATIAEHLQQGKRLPMASAFWLRAGRVALAACDAKAAIERFGRTVEIEDTRTGELRSRASQARLREALAGRELAYGQLGDYDAQGRDLDRLEAMVRDDTELLAMVKNRRALRCLRLGEYSDALCASEEAERAAHASGDELSLGEAVRIRAEMYERLGDFDRAIALTRQALAIFRQLEAGGEETKTMIGLARISVVRADYQTAASAYQEILTRLSTSGDVWLERVVRNHMAVLELCIGEFETALASIRRALDLCRLYGDRAREGDCLSVCGIVLSEAGRYQEARLYFNRALSVLERTGSRWSQADCLVYAGMNEAAAGSYERALPMIDQGAYLADELGAQYIRANAANARAYAFLCRGRQAEMGEARRAAERGVAVAREATLVSPEILGLSRQAWALGASGALDEALALSREAVELLRRQQHIEGPEEEVYYTRYQLLLKAGDPAASEARAWARAEVVRKLGRIRDDELRQAYASVPMNAVLLAEGAPP